VIDDFDGDNFDHGPAGFIGGATINSINTGGRPIQQMACRPARRAGARAGRRP
jgi:gluconate 2-dehydrogenase alpha chain